MVLFLFAGIARLALYIQCNNRAGKWNEKSQKDENTVSWKRSEGGGWEIKKKVKNPFRWINRRLVSTFSRVFNSVRTRGDRGMQKNSFFFDFSIWPAPTLGTMKKKNDSNYLNIFTQKKKQSIFQKFFYIIKSLSKCLVINKMWILINN